jgi:hypothetical protein
MGEGKAQVSIRFRQGTRAEIEGFAARERRTMSNVSEWLLECGIAQLKSAGSIDQLVRTRPHAETCADDSAHVQRRKERESVLRSAKFQITLRVRPALRSELEEMAQSGSTLSARSPLFSSNGAMNSSRPSARRSGCSSAECLWLRTIPKAAGERMRPWRTGPKCRLLPECARVCGRE